MAESAHPRPYVPGVAPIKPEYIIAAEARKAVDDDAAESHTGPLKRPTTSDETGADIDGGADGGTNAPTKLKGAARKRAKKEAVSAARGRGRSAQSSSGGAQNKGRKFNAINDGYRICNPFAEGMGCQLGSKCRFLHDIPKYLQNKSCDIHLPEPPQIPSDSLPISYGSLWAATESTKQEYLDVHYSKSAPFVKFSQREQTDVGESSTQEKFDPTTVCPLYHSLQKRKLWDANGTSEAYCPLGLRCRFLGGHAEAVEQGKGYEGSDVQFPWSLEAPKMGAGGQADGTRCIIDERNVATSATAKQLRLRLYDLPKTKAALAYLNTEETEYNKSGIDAKGPIVLTEQDVAAAQASINASRVDVEEDLDDLVNASSSSARQRAEDASLSQTTSSIDLARIRRSEKRKLDWYHGELYLAPLTTTGNLPFRRICATFGSDIHCGEMGLAGSYLDGNKSEWSLVRRWEGEKTFGIQLCGNKPDLLVPTAEVMAREFGSSGGLDFVDINCGCPIDMVFQHGGGSALLDHPRKLGRIIRGMDAVLGDIPVTVKLRTGVTDKRTSHHRIMPRVQTEWGAGAVTMHGRSRKQRYSRKADWSYIRDCAQELRDSVRAWNEESKTADEEEMKPIPVYGNGDVYSQQEYYENLEKTGVDGEMLARGALIKPWLFTEIKERRDWDISSRERLDMVRQYVHYGLTHWGSDTQGVNKTRRFLCEAMSFWHRYVPLGLLEHLPPSMNDRPPAFRGRDDLETLLASDDKADWVKVSEMFLGKSPSDFEYVPKHKSNSYTESAEQQG
ncbi:unnamed protein product [Parajaminaea phylloscopi]